MVGRQTPFLALIVPLILVGMVDGMRGVRQCWPAAMVGGLARSRSGSTRARTSSRSSSPTSSPRSSPSARSSRSCASGSRPSRCARSRASRDRRWRAGRRPTPPSRHEARRREGGGEGHRDSRKDVLTAYAPYVIIIAIFGIAQSEPGQDVRWRTRSRRSSGPASTSSTPRARRPAPSHTPSTTSRPRAALLLIAGLISMLVLRVSPGRAIRIYGETLDQLKWATLTVMAVLGLAYVMNLSGQTTTIGQWIAGAGSVLPFLSPIIGWLGVAVTGSDTSSNSLFGVLQVTAAKDAGFDPTLLAAANSSGGVLGKMISPQNLAIGAAAVGLAGQEGAIFRKVIGWSLALAPHHVHHRLPAIDKPALVDGGLSPGAARRVAPRLRRRLGVHPGAPAADLRVRRAAAVPRAPGGRRAARERGARSRRSCARARARACRGSPGAPAPGCPAARCRSPRAS